MKSAIPMTIAIAILLFTRQSARADSLQGVVVNESGKGIPGLTVSLAHPVVGRSLPSITWGKDLLYRTNMKIQENMTAPQIRLHH